MGKGAMLICAQMLVFIYILCVGAVFGSAAAAETAFCKTRHQIAVHGKRINVHLPEAEGAVKAPVAC